MARNVLSRTPLNKIVAILTVYHTKFKGVNQAVVQISLLNYMKMCYHET